MDVEKQKIAGLAEDAEVANLLRNDSSIRVVVDVVPFLIGNNWDTGTASELSRGT